jgi:hypothetical protein
MSSSVPTIGAAVTQLTGFSHVARSRDRPDRNADLTLKLLRDNIFHRAPRHSGQPWSVTPPTLDDGPNFAFSMRRTDVLAAPDRD